MALAQKFDVVSESHRFLYEFLVLSRDMAHNACRQTYVLDSMAKNDKWTTCLSVFHIQAMRKT